MVGICSVVGRGEGAADYRPGWGFANSPSGLRNSLRTLVVFSLTSTHVNHQWNSALLLRVARQASLGQSSGAKVRYRRSAKGPDRSFKLVLKYRCCWSPAAPGLFAAKWVAPRTRASAPQARA